MLTNIAGEPCCAADGLQPDSRLDDQVQVAMLIDDPNNYAIVGGGLEGANCIQFHTRILLPENRRRMHWRNIQR